MERYEGLMQGNVEKGVLDRRPQRGRIISVDPSAKEETTLLTQKCGQKCLTMTGSACSSRFVYI